MEITVQKGNTTWGIAKKELNKMEVKTSPNSIHKFVEEIKAENNLKENGQLVIGQKITIPNKEVAEKCSIFATTAKTAKATAKPVEKPAVPTSTTKSELSVLDKVESDFTDPVPTVKKVKTVQTEEIEEDNLPRSSTNDYDSKEIKAKYKYSNPDYKLY